MLNDITGLSGQRIPHAILAGNRDPVALAQLCHARVKSSRDTVAKALEGDYRGDRPDVICNPNDLPHKGGWPAVPYPSITEPVTLSTLFNGDGLAFASS